ncbi:MAG: hypothetical protein IJF27_06350, partial [Oscillospiraceae bacterium]|nr:hypothetical protein [Oscillospiraceae bacterium]MBQ9836119.1 hypothetical protein [Akkermansia sp.]
PKHPASILADACGGYHIKISSYKGSLGTFGDFFGRLLGVAFVFTLFTGFFLFLCVSNYH